MNRRSFVGGTLAALVPTWFEKQPQKRMYDLSAFCSPKYRNHRYAMGKPFTQADSKPWVFATDAKICVRVPSLILPDSEPDRRLPPASALDWSHDKGSGWNPWPKQNHIGPPDEKCFVCGGTGRDREFPEIECWECSGDGIIEYFKDQPIGNVFIDARYDEKIRKVIGECDYRVVTLNSINNSGSWPAIQFRADGICGILMTIEKERAKS